MLTGAAHPDAQGLLDDTPLTNTRATALVFVPAELPSWAKHCPGAIVISVVGATELIEDRLVLDLDTVLHAHEHRRTPSGGGPDPIHTAPGTRWAQVCITVTDHQAAVVEVPGARHERSPASMGLGDRRQDGGASRLWGLLCILARQGGVLDHSIPAAIQGKQRKYVSRLRLALSSFLPGLDGDPLPYDDVDHCYRTAFRITLAE